MYGCLVGRGTSCCHGDLPLPPVAQHRKVQAMVHNSVSGDKVEEGSSDEGEESTWNWREDPK